MKTGDCVSLPDGRIGRVREIDDGKIRVRAMRTTSKAHQFLWLRKTEIKVVSCPTGWMSPEGYNRYLKITLEKMKKRLHR